MVGHLVLLRQHGSGVTLGGAGWGVVVYAATPPQLFILVGVLGVLLVLLVMWPHWRH